MITFKNLRVGLSLQLRIKHNTACNVIQYTCFRYKVSTMSAVLHAVRPVCGLVLELVINYLTLELKIKDDTTTSISEIFTI